MCKQGPCADPPPLFSRKARHMPCPCCLPPAVQAWLEGMMVCGGGSSVPGLGGRLLKEVRGLTTQQITPLLCSLPEYMPEGTLRHAAWMGGAVLARVAFSQAGGFITKADYEEQGPAAVLKKCV